MEPIPMPTRPDPNSDFAWLMGVLREMAYIFIRNAERRYGWGRKN